VQASSIASFLPPLQRGKWLRRPKQRFGVLQAMGARAPLRQFVLFLFSAISAMFGAVNR